MPKELAVLSFDYSALEKDAKGKLIWLAGEISKQNSSHVKTGMEVGRLLSEARCLLGSEQSFKSWVEAECGHSLRSAYNYIAAFENFGSCANFARIELSAMYELTKSDKAKNKALKLADRGVRVTHAIAKDLVESEKPGSVAAGRDARNSEGTPGTPKGGSNPPATSSNGSGDGHRPPRSGKERDSAPVDYGKCPNCAGTKWTADEFGASCAKCHQPHGEARGDADEDRVDIQRSKTVKTCEALMRAFDDLNMLLAKSDHPDAIAQCKFLLTIARNWK